LQFVAPSGTFTVSTGIGTVTGAIVAATGQGTPGSQAVTISTTSGSFATGVACISDQYAFEMVNLTAASSTSITASFRRPHLAGAVLLQGGTCGWGIAMNADTTQVNGTTIRVLIPMLGSPDSAHTYVNTFIGANYFGEGSAWAYNSDSASATYSSATGMVTVTGNFTFNYSSNAAGGLGSIYGQSLTIAGSSDPNYNGTYPVTVTSAGSFTYTPTSAPTATSETGLTVTECNCTFTMYPRAEVLTVYNTTTKQVDGTLTLEPNTVAWASGDTVEVPHWHQPLVNDTHDFVTMYTPQSAVYGRGYRFGGTVTGDLHGFDLRNTGELSQYQGYGGWHAPPNTAQYIQGWWNTTFTVPNAPKTTLFNVGCKPDTTNLATGVSNHDGCTKWDAAYSLMQLEANVSGTETANAAQFNFNPTANNFSFLNTGTPCVSTIGEAVGTVSGTSYGGIAINNYSPCALFTPGLVLGSASTPLTAQTGTSGTVVTSTAPTVSGATLNGTTTVPASQTLTVAGTLNITGTCTGCNVSVPGSSGQFLMSNGANGFASPVGSTGTGSVMLSASPTTTGTLTAASIAASGTSTFAGSSNFNGPVSFNYASAAAYFNAPFFLRPQGTATSTTNYPSNYGYYQASVWTGTTACNPAASPIFSASASAWTFVWSVTSRSGCSGITPSAITDDHTGFADGVKVTHLLSGGAGTLTAAAGSGAGMGATVNLSNASDVKGMITVTAGSAAASSSAIATVTFGTAYGSAPVCSVTPASASAMGTYYVPAATTASFSLNSGTAPLVSGTTYTYSYLCLD
jgi:hypothetical protein